MDRKSESGHDGRLGANICTRAEFGLRGGVSAGDAGGPGAGGGWDDSAERCGRSCRDYWSGRSFWSGGDGRLGFRLALVPKER